MDSRILSGILSAGNAHFANISIVGGFIVNDNVLRFLILSGSIELSET
ncbi:hypothetical protein FORMB_16850 [Formosa sp. Hel1_33_131]|nr:hypothetical protein FORMB_16850 [Formosa sp. Hel1_33_131]